ncbi:hypothetical protein TNCV_1467391 [Trichonephila clavipes]|uniref:Uncharacterized protein n=1 Tax=Trichonephila clavipes TaxID=2585209 RepID=A0A8X6V246_TRICX|nr:hypothetical protein TNCV_1467391 [Trichonephila clavipes]
MLNVGEIVTSVPEEPDPVDDETDADENNNNNESSKECGRRKILQIHNIYNVDETGVNWMALPKKSLASKRRKNEGVRWGNEE